MSDCPTCGWGDSHARTCVHPRCATLPPKKLDRANDALSVQWGAWGGNRKLSPKFPSLDEALRREQLWMDRMSAIVLLGFIAALAAVAYFRS